MNRPTGHTALCTSDTLEIRPAVSYSNACATANARCAAARGHAGNREIRAVSYPKEITHDAK